MFFMFCTPENFQCACAVVPAMPVHGRPSWIEEEQKGNQYKFSIASVKQAQQTIIQFLP
jgi:hypothetical protein